MSAAALELAYRAGRTTPAEVVSRALRAAADIEPLHAFVRLDVDAVHTQAEASTARWSAGRPLSPLDGVPVAIKDQLDVAGLPTTCGAGGTPPPAARDADAVARLRAAGAIVFGKTNMTELALAPTGANVHHGAARNPWDPARDPGGSSSGSAVAVAAGVVSLALGTDLGGSIRIPAALCGVPSLKPTFGRVPTGGVAHVAWSLEHVGPIGDTIDDLVRALAVLTGTDVTLPATGRVRAGIDDAWWRAAEPETRARVDAAIDQCGFERVAVHIDGLDQALAVGALVCNAEAATVTADRLLSAPVRVALALGRSIRAVEYIDAQRIRARIAAALDRALAGVDVLITPTTTHPARPYTAAQLSGELDEEAFARRVAFTFPANLAGLPAAQVPVDPSDDGLPIGLQVIAPHGADALALAVAARVESIIERRRP